MESPRTEDPIAERIFVVDDEPGNRELAEAFLTSASYEVTLAPDGPTALALAAADPPDLILLDVHMPGMGGYEVCWRLRQGPRTRQVPVVMLTATDDPALNRLAYAAGA
jgi:two-component system cell cycle response regulator